MKKDRADQIKEGIATQIRAFLAEKEWSQRDFAEKLGKNLAHVSHILQAKQNLTIETIAEIEKVLGHTLILLPKLARKT